DKIAELVGVPAGGIEFLDFNFKPGKLWPDKELKGLDFLPDNHPARIAWDDYWPQTGNVQNWDAVCKLAAGPNEEWLLIEAKAHLRELQSTCGAKERGGLPQIRRAFEATIEHLNIDARVDSWLSPYFQHANRLAVLSFLHRQRITTRLLNVYFVGDVNGQGRVSPQTRSEWLTPLKNQDDALGLSNGHALAPFVHKLLLNVASSDEP
ncbi:MAG: hypothetical protein AABZ77_09770, partial [Chloroflexota bacterium]